MLFNGNIYNKRFDMWKRGADVKQKIAILLIFFLLNATLSGCNMADGADINEPTMITLWHNFSGRMRSTISEQIDIFNHTTGIQENIFVTVTSNAGSAEIQNRLSMIAAGETDAPEMPDITICYPQTAVLLQEKELIAPLDNYFTQEELAAYVPSFIEEGRLSDGSLYVFPFAKSTEALFLNKTLFDTFAQENDITLDDLSTFEGIARAARVYYDWTDAQTPEIAGDGKAFFAADSLFNIAQIGMYQMGESLFEGESFRCDSEAFRRIWDFYYETAVKGGFAIYDGYPSDLFKTGEIVCATGSTAGVMFYGSQMITGNLAVPIELRILPFPVFENGKKAAIQRGNGMAVARSTPQKEKAAVTFLKWFTAHTQNKHLTERTGYLPVTYEALQALESKTGCVENPFSQKDTHFQKEYVFYIPPAFPRFNTCGKTFETQLQSRMREARKNYLTFLKDMTPEEAYVNASKNDYASFIHTLT